jgi:chromosome segregation protein
VYLKRLEMLGFKSFADKTELVFQPGMTAVVGPNGCGKSNVVDAFKWIFGEQSAKGMRGAEMKDVIFNGTQERKPTGFAEVSIVFENSDRFLDIDYAEVAITRRLFRSGESEYLINKQRARLKDIRELFMGTGIGQTSYSILEQGKIDVLLQASHADRRFIFEEAAGISKYLSKKAETLRALLRVEENLTRLNDIVNEVEKRLQRVKAQASKARRYRELSERLKYLRVRLAIGDYRESVLSRADVSFRLFWCNSQLAALEKVLEQLSASLASKTNEREAQAEALKALRDALQREQMQKERTLERVEQERRRTAELEEERERKTADLESTRIALEQLRERLDAAKEDLRSLKAEIGTRKGDYDRVLKDLEELRRAQERLECEVKGKKAGVVTFLQKLSRLGNNLVALDAEIGNLKAQRDRIRNACEGFRKEKDEARQKEALEQKEVQRLRGELERLEKMRSTLEADASRIQVELDSLEADRVKVVELLHQRRSRFEVLQSLEESLEGIGRGVADILRKKAQSEALLEVHGMAASLVRVERKYARAVEGVLGVHAQSLVVETQEGALGLLDIARDENVGALEVISLDRVDVLPKEDFPKEAGVLGPLRERVEVAAEYCELFDRLLANVVLVEDFDTAIALSRNGLRPFRLVTLSGEVIEPWGGLSIAGESELGIISRRSEMDELGKDVLKLEGEESLLRERQSSLKGQLLAKREELNRVRGESSHIERGIVQVEGSLTQLQQAMERLEREMTLGASEAAEMDEQVKSRDGEKLELEREISRADAEMKKEEDVIRLLEEVLAGEAEKVRLLSEDLTQARLELAQAEKREEGLRELVASQEANHLERQSHIEDLRAELALLVERHAEAEETIRLGEADLRQISAREESLLQDVETEESAERRFQELDQLYHRETEKVHQESARVQREREETQLRDQEERHKRNSVVERIQEEYGMDLPSLLEEDAAPSPTAESLTGEGAREEEKYLLPDPDFEREKAREEIRELQEKIRRLGGVNLEALDELSELEERYRFQEAQRNDLLESEKKLRGIIGEINHTSREMFLKTFEEIQGHFSDLFRKCFEGGKAELVLEEGSDVLDAGIEIVARPPGKKLTSLSLMSGGEKTMTTLALLFAIFRARPSPFCVLDEVDAPLDETNVHRFVVLLKDFLPRTQCIVVTHNKISMAEASTLYGITMQERGVSKRVSVELESYDPEKLAPAASAE